MKDLKQFNNDVEYFCININYHIRKKRKAKPTNIPQQQILKKDVTSSA